MNSKVDEFFESIQNWKNELLALRHIALECGLTEELKWGQPCYTYNSHNVAILAGFKQNCVFSFVKGVMLNDAEGLLEKPGENSQTGRVMRFTAMHDIEERAVHLKRYIFEAIEIEKAGLKPEKQDNTKLVYCSELAQKLSATPSLRLAFESLTPGRQRAYNMHFEVAKQSKTRMARIEQYSSRILAGKGINDCICGKSKRMPNCDGSHKYV